MVVIIKGRTWRNIPKKSAAEVRQLLLSHGGTEDTELKGGSEVWRVRCHGAVFTYYSSGSLFFSGGEISELSSLSERISELVGQGLERPERKVLIGLDETGKGEVLGHSILCVVKVRSDILRSLDQALSTADTKKRKSFAFWDSLFKELDRFSGRGMMYEIETLPPWDVDKYNVNKIMDVVYQRILSRMVRGVNLQECRIIVDDYGVGKNLNEFLSTLHKAAAEMRVESKADDKYVEVRAAAVLSKWRQQFNMMKINERYALPDTPVGSGNAGDPATLKWLQAWKKKGERWPWFVKTSFSTVRDLDGFTRSIRKAEPPIRHELLSKESRDSFREGLLSTSSLRIVCPSCGMNISACKLTPNARGDLVGRCVSCSSVISDLSPTLRYYCGFIVPDSSALIAGVISKDLDEKGFFEGFTMLLDPVVRKETDNPGGKKELERLGDFAAMGRIAFRTVVGKENVEPGEHDIALIENAKNNEAILVTFDRGMYGNAVSQGVFCLTMKT